MDKEINNKTREVIAQKLKEFKDEKIEVIISAQLSTIIDLLIDLRDEWKSKF